MNEITQILQRIEQGELHAGHQLLPLIYDELRRLAAHRLAHESPGQTLQATALVHEAYLRLVGTGDDVRWDSRGHFFAAAAEAMRRILVDAARRKSSVKHGGEMHRVELDDHELPIEVPPEELLALDEALTRLEHEDSEAASIVRLHYFAGLTMEQVAETLGLSRATAYRHWTFARAWLRSEIELHG